MMRMSVLSTILLVVVSSAGCGCCRWCLPKPAVAACPPPAPYCDPCATAPVTYGAAPPAVVPYTPPPQW
jgi:hypothetical protein